MPNRWAVDRRVRILRKKETVLRWCGIVQLRQVGAVDASSHHKRPSADATRSGAVRRWRYRYTADQLFDKLARGEVKNDPFNAEKFDDWVRKAMQIFPGSEARPEDMPQRISIRFLEAALQAAGDQDRSGMRHFC